MPQRGQEEEKIYCIFTMGTHKNPCPGVMKFTHLVDPPLVIITILLSLCLIYALVWRRRFFKKKDAFSLYTLYGHILAQGPLYQGS